MRALAGIQAAKFGTETQYQHLMFEEFARKGHGGVCQRAIPVRALDADRDAQHRHRPERRWRSADVPNRGLRQPAGIPGPTCRQHRGGLGQPGRQRDRRVRDRGAAQQPASREDADAADGDGSLVSPAPDDEAGGGTQGLSVSAARHRDHAAQSGLGDGHHLHSDGQGLGLSRGRARMVLAAGPGVACVDHDGRSVLHRGAAGGAGASRQAGDLQHGPRLAVTGAAFTGVLAAKQIRISMDGKGAWRDSVFIERLWRTIKCEEVYLHAYESVRRS